MIARHENPGPVHEVRKRAEVLEGQVTRPDHQVDPELLGPASTQVGNLLVADRQRPNHNGHATARNDRQRGPQPRPQSVADDARRTTRPSPRRERCPSGRYPQSCRTAFRVGRAGSNPPTVPAGTETNQDKPQAHVTVPAQQVKAVCSGSMKAQLDPTQVKEVIAGSPAGARRSRRTGLDGAA